MNQRALNRRQFNQRFLAAGAATLAAPAVFAQQWPGRPIRVLVPYSPGGFTDVTARLVTQKLQERLGQTVVVDNKPGANGIIAVDALAKSAPDGYTFAVVIAAYAANNTLYPKLPYDPRKDLTGVSLIGVTPLVAAVNKDAPFKTVAELTDYTRKHPGKMSVGSSGNGSSAHLSSELLKAMTQVDMVHVPYRGSAPALTDLMGGQIQLILDSASSLTPFSKAGKLRLIGIASEHRLPVLPEVPTFIEQGVKGFTGSTWAGMLAPKGTPAEVVKRMSDEIARIVRLDDVKARLEAMGTIPVGGTSAEFDTFIASETVKWGKVIRDAKVTLD